MKEITLQEFLAQPALIESELSTDSKNGIILKFDNSRFVLLSLGEYNSITETLHLLSTTANAERIMTGMKHSEK